MTKKKGIRCAIIYILLIVFLVITLLPYLWLVLTSFKTKLDAFSIPPKVFFQVTFDNYREAFLDGGDAEKSKKQFDYYDCCCRDWAGHWTSLRLCLFQI